MTTKDVLLEILLFIGGTFFYGIRASIGKWLVSNTFKLLRRMLIRTEKQAAVYLHARHVAIAKRKDSARG